MTEGMDKFAAMLLRLEKEIEGKPPCASVYVDREGKAIEIVLNTSRGCFGEWIKGEAATSRCIATEIRIEWLGPIFRCTWRTSVSSIRAHRKAKSDRLNKRMICWTELAKAAATVVTRHRIGLLKSGVDSPGINELQQALRAVRDAPARRIACPLAQSSNPSRCWSRHSA